MNQTRNRKPTTWPKHSVAIISSEQHLVTILRNILNPTGWQIAGQYPTAVGAAFAIREGRADAIIADDLPDQPVSSTLRFLITSPITDCTPVIALSGINFETESNSLSTLGRPRIAPKPITPSRILTCLDGLMREWESDDMVRLRQAAYLMQKGDNQNGIIRLKQLIAAPMAGPLAAQALAILLRQIGKLKDAEGLLLSWLKKDPTNLTVISGMVDLYLTAAMPHLAHRLLTATTARIKPSLILHPDLIQATLLKGDIQEAISLMHILLNANYKTNETTTFLAKLLFAIGREKEAALLLARDRVFLTKFQKSWQVADLIPLPAAG